MSIYPFFIRFFQTHLAKVISLYQFGLIWVYIHQNVNIMLATVQLNENLPYPFYDQISTITHLYIKFAHGAIIEIESFDRAMFTYKIGNHLGGGVGFPIDHLCINFFEP